jgi:hypothetical protein
MAIPWEAISLQGLHEYLSRYDAPLGILKTVLHP